MQVEQELIVARETLKTTEILLNDKVFTLYGLTDSERKFVEENA